MGVIIRPDSPYYWLTIPRQGERPLRRATRILVKAATSQQTRENRTLAHVAYSQALTDHAKADLGLAEAHSPRLTVFLRRYAAWLRQRRPRTAAETIRRLKLASKALDNPPLHKITPANVQRWQATRKVTAQTFSRDVNDLRGALSRAVEWGLIKAHPLATLKLSVAASPEVLRYLTTDEESRLLKALTTATLRKPDRARLTALVVLSIHTGLRRGELFRLTWANVDLAAHVITVQPETSKSGKARRVPLNSTALAALHVWRSEVPPRTLVFPGRSGELTNTKRSWRRVLTAAGITAFRWHDMRHTFASRLVQKGVPLYVVSELLGHGSERMTRRYAHLAPNQGQAAVGHLVHTIITATTRRERIKTVVASR